MIFGKKQQPPPPPLIVEMQACPGHFPSGFGRSDAGGVAILYEDAFKGECPDEALCDPKQLRRENKTGRMLSFVVRDMLGGVEGHVYFKNSAPYDRIMEWGGLMIKDGVSPTDEIAAMLLDYSINAAAANGRIEGVFTHMLCNQETVQKAYLHRGLKTTAIAVDSTPGAGGAAADGGGESSGRTATALSFRLFKFPQQTVYLPLSYHYIMQMLYSPFEEGRNFVWTKAQGFERVSTLGKMALFKDSGMARIIVERIGADFEIFTANLEAQASTMNPALLQMWLPLNSPSLSAAVDALRAGGYFLGGILPRWFDADAMLMQKMHQMPDWEEIKVAGYEGKELLEAVRADWQNTN